MSDGHGAGRRGAGPDLGRTGLARAALVLSLCVLPAAAQTADYSRVLGKDDEAFARNLSRYGYSDLAEVVLGALEKSGGGKGTLRGGMIRLELEQDRASREPDVNKRIGLLEDLIATREEFANKNPGSVEATEILDGQLELYRTVGELIIQALQQKDTPEPEKLQKRGAQILEKAVDALEQRMTALAEEEATPDLTPEQKEELYFQKMIASYGLARTQYFRAVLYEEGFERSLLAKKALEILLDFQLEYSDQLLCYEGYIYEGLANECIAANDKAFESFDAAIKLRETYEQGRNGVYQMAPEAADIVSSAVQQKMLLQAKLGDHAGAAATAKDFLASTNEPWTALKGLAVLSLQADAYQALGDQKALTEVAKTLVEVNPFGPGGQRGRELLGGGGGGGSSTLGAVEVLKLAQSAMGKEPERAIDLCQRVMILARGTPDQANLGASAGMLLGYLYNQRGALHEAVVAWDGAAQRYPDGKDAPDCLWRAINGYLALQGQERRTIYKTLAQERMSELQKRYPQHQYASMTGLIEGQQAEAEQDFTRAALAYERIAPGSTGHEEGLYRAGNAWSRQARKLFAEGNTKDAKDAVQKADALLVKARAALEEAASKTLETSLQDRMRGIAFNARLAQADLYLLEGVNRAADVVALFQGIDQQLAKDPARMSQVWDRRFRALRAQNKLDEATALLDAQIRLDPKAVWLENGAGALAPILDTRGQELAKADPRSSEVDRLWGRAATYYQLAIRGQLDGTAAIQVEQLEGVADRLFVFGLRLEGVPDTVETFAEWGGKRLTNELLERAAQAYAAVLPLTPSHRTVIKLARTLGFLGRWEEAAAQYAELFERESFVDRVTNTINQEAVAAKPEMLFAYVEWGVAEREVGIEPSDTSKLLRAQRIFEALVLGTVQGSKLWWQAKFYHLQTLVDLGQYEIADVSLDSIEMNWPEFDEGQYGLQRRFGELREELSKKVFK